MKQEICKKMIQTSTKEKRSDLDVLNISDFYSMHLKEKKKFSEKMFFTDKNIKKKKERFVTLQEFKKIITTYLGIYFMELYFMKIPKYFFLGGMMKIVKYPTWMNKQSRGSSPDKKFIIAEEALGLFWYRRPSQKSFYMVVLKKLTGKFNALPAIEVKFKKNNNKDLLPIFEHEHLRAQRNKSLYTCIPIQYPLQK